MISPQHNRLHLLVEEESTVDHSQTNVQQAVKCCTMSVFTKFFMTECKICGNDYHLAGNEVVTYKLH